MTEPTSASIVISSVKSSLKELLIKVCGAEQRTTLLSTLLKLKLLTRDVKNFSRKQLMQERRNQDQVQRGFGEKLFQAGKQRMLKKLSSSKSEERRLRKERDQLRSKLEDKVSQSVMARMIREMKSKVDRIRKVIRDKNQNKVKEYLLERDREVIQEMSTLREEMGEFGNLKIFNGISIPTEERKPPVTSKEVTLSKYEVEVLSMNPQWRMFQKMMRRRG